MKIAVACKEDGTVSAFGLCTAFALFDFKGGDYSAPVGSELVSTEGIKGHSALAGLLNERDVAMVLCESMGPDARHALLDLGIMPVSGYQGEAKQGAIDLLQGRVPLTPASCDSCSGNCSSGCCGE